MKERVKTVRNGKVEFWRFVFSVIIVIHHSRNLVGDKDCMFLGGSLAVEFFFFLSGYLMMASIEKVKEAPTQLGRETLNYLGRKFRGLMPDLLIAHLIAMLFVSYAKDYSLSQMVKLFVSSFFEVTQLKMAGIYSVSLNGVTWYISTMLISMAVLYPLIRKYPDIMTNIVAPLVAVIFLGYLSENYDSPRSPLTWIGMTYKGNIRGVAELCLGVVGYRVCAKIKAYSLTDLGKTLVTVVEWLCYIIAIWYMYTQKASQMDYFAMMLLLIGVILSFSHQGIDASLFDCRLIAFLGKSSTALFLCHTFYAQNLNQILPEWWSDNRRMLVYLCCTTVTALVVGLLSKCLRKAAPGMKAFMTRLLVKEA